MRRLLWTATCALLLSALSPVGRAASAGLHCNLTNRDIEACCCESRNGALYCTLAKRAIPSCCCSGASAKARMQHR